MRNSFLARLVLGAAAFMAGAASWAQAASVVTIYSYARDGGSSQGTGFLLGNAGLVVTAYHVVQHAKDLEVVDATSKVHAGVKVVALDHRHDVSVLYVDALKGITGFQLATAVPSHRSEIRIFGSPRGLPKQVLYGRTTAETGTIDSTQLSSASGTRIFAERIKVIPLDVTIYGGMSGAPVLDSNGEVIGLLSGSYDEGGGLAWAIPSLYIKELTTASFMARDPTSISSWPPLTLMATSWISLKRSYKKRFDGEHMKKLEALAGFYSRLRGSTWYGTSPIERTELYDSVIGRCVREADASAVVSFPFFDAEQAVITGRFESKGGFRAVYTPNGEQFGNAARDGCSKNVMGNLGGSSARLRLKADLRAEVGGANDDRLVVTLNVDECVLNGGDCPSKEFGKRKAGSVEFVNDKMFKWQRMVFRKE